MRISDWSSDVCSSGSEVAGIADGLARVALECVELSTGSRTGPGWIAVAAVGNESDIRAEAVHRLLHRLAVRHCDVGQRQQVAIVPGQVLLFFLRDARPGAMVRSEEHTSELQSLMRISYAVFCLKKKK